MKTITRNLRTVLPGAFPVLFLVLSTLSPGSARASDWTGVVGDWSSNDNPGWNGTGIPNGAGAIANFGAGSGSGTTTQDISGGVTVGTISYSAGNANLSRTINPSANGITLDNGGAGALISNTNTFAGTSNILIFSQNSTLTLADNLLISNTGNSTNVAIYLGSAIAGAGNVTFSNTSTALTQAGSIQLANNPASTFVGSVLVRQGTVTFFNATAFGNAANVVTLGQSGAGDAAILAAYFGNVANNITVAAGTGGTSTLGSLFLANTTSYSGTITLNQDVNLVSAKGSGLRLTGSITGPGGVIANPAPNATGPVSILLEGNNNFTGTTTVNNNVTVIAAATSGNQALGGTSGVVVNSGGTLLLTQANQINNSATMTLNGGTFNTNGKSEGMAAMGGAGIGALTLTANSTIDFGTGASILHFSGIGAHTPITGADLAILNWSGLVAGGGTDQLLFTGMASEFMAAYDQSDVSFNGETGYRLVEFDGFYELTPVPEPGTWAAGLLVIVTLGFSHRKRLRKLVFSTRSVAERA